LGELFKLLLTSSSETILYNSLYNGNCLWLIFNEI
jgi:hypothetical protein